LELGIYKSVQVLKVDAHRKVRVRPILKLDYAAEVTDTLLTIDEFFSAARSQPIVFGRGENGQHFPAALLGLGRKRNWFLDKEGKWKSGEYMPAFLRRYPFVFVESDGTSYLAIDEQSGAFNEEEGEFLFDEEGKATKYTQVVLGFLQEYEAANKRTAAFCAELQRLELFEPIVIQKWVGFQAPLLRNIKRISEKKLENLPREEVESLVTKGYYKLIVAHLISLGHIERISN
jgi:hypothetical protein